MQFKSFIELATPGVQKLSPYIPGKPVEELERELGIKNSIKLASNENPLGPGNLALEAIKKHIGAINYYPDGSGFKLSNKIANLHGIEASNVTLGNGSNDILELVARAFLSRDHSAVFSQYSFAVYPIVVQAVGAKANVAKAFPESHGSMPLGHDPDAMLDAIDNNTRVLFIANPNNPTGTWLEKGVLKQLVGQVPGHVIVVLDLAYNEYMDEQYQIDTAAWLNEFPNLIITQTFSKIHALAGLRVGYGLSSKEIAGILNRVRQPFNTNLLAQEAAVAALDDVEHIKKSIAVNNQGKQFLQDAFDNMNLVYLPTMGNFISIHLGQDANPIYHALLKKGLIVRPVANYDMPEYLRVTIGDMNQNKVLIKALSEILQ